MQGSSSRIVVYAALVGNLAIAITKFGAAWYTGSSALTSEAVHSLVDTVNEVLLLFGLWRARQPADEAHPMGYGREIYFWAFIVALLIFSLGAGLSLLEGLHRLGHPEPVTNVGVAYGVIAASLVFELASWTVAMREFRASKGRAGWLEAVRRSKDPVTFTVLFEDSAAVIGLVIALAGTWASTAFDAPALDGWASIGISGVLATTAVLLARESKGLLIGERARPALSRALCRIATTHPGVRAAGEVMTIHLAPEEVVAALSLHFDEGLRSGEVEAAVRDIEQAVRREHPEVKTLFVTPRRAA